MPDSEVNRIIVENVSKEDIEDYVGMLTYDEELYQDIVDRLKQKGFDVSPQEAREIILNQYYADMRGLNAVRNEYGVVGEFVWETGASIGHLFTTPLRFTAATAGVAVVKGGAGAIAGSVFGPVGAGIGFAGGIALGAAEGIGIANADAVVNAYVVNKRRAEIGLKPIDVTEALFHESLLGATLPVALGVGGLAAGLAANIVVRPLWERAVLLFNDTRAGRFKRTGFEPEEVLKSQMSTPVQEMPARWGYNEKHVSSGFSEDVPRETYSWDIKPTEVEVVEEAPSVKQAAETVMEDVPRETEAIETVVEGTQSETQGVEDVLHKTEDVETVTKEPKSVEQDTETIIDESIGDTNNIQPEIVEGNEPSITSETLEVKPASPDSDVSRETKVVKKRKIQSRIDHVKTEGGKTTKRTSVWTYDADEGTPELNRNMFNSIGTIMADTSFTKKISKVEREKLKGLVGKLSEQDLGLFSESMRVAKGSPEELNAFVKVIKQSDSIESFGSNMRENLFPGGKVKFSIRVENPRTMMDSETFRNVITHSDDAAIVEDLLLQGEIEHVSRETFSAPVTNIEGPMSPKYTKENAYLSRLQSSQTPEGRASAEIEADLWERARADAIEYGFDPSKKFTPTAYMMSMISKMNAYTAIRETYGAQYGSVFEKLNGMKALDLIHAFMPTELLQKPVDGKASFIKNALSKLKKERRDIAARYGFEYGTIDDHVPQKWAAEAIGQAGLEKFVNDVMPALDLHKTKMSYDASVLESKYKLQKELEIEQKRLAAKQQNKVENVSRETARIRKIETEIAELDKILQKPFGIKELGQIYTNITQDDLLSFGTESVKAKLSGQKRRILHFNTIVDFERINKLYGTTPDIRNLIRLDFESNIRDIARLQALDGMSGAAFMRDVEAKVQNLLVGRPLGGKTETFVKNLVEANVKYIDGLRNRPSVSTWGAIGRLYLALRRNATLGGSGLTALFDDAQQAAFVGSQNGFGLWRTLQHYVDGITKSKLTSEEASKLLVHLDSLEVSFNDEFFRDMQTKTAKKISDFAQGIDTFTFKVSGNSYLTDRGRYAYHKLFLEELAHLENRPKFQKTLKNFGLTEVDFKKISQLPRDSDGYVEFTPEFKETKGYIKLLTALHTTRRNAIAQTSQSLKAVMATSEGGMGVSMGVINSLFFLKRIPLQVWFDHTLTPLMRGEGGKFLTYTVQNMIATTARMTLKYMALGYTPDYEDPNFWVEVFLQTSIWPPFGKDVLLTSKLNAYDFSMAIGKSFLGAYSPLIDLGAYAASQVRYAIGTGPPGNVGALAVRVLEDFAPLKNHPALAALYERQIFDNLKFMMDPRAMEHLARREKFRRETGLIRQGNPVGW